MSKDDTKRPYVYSQCQIDLTSVKTIDLTSLIPVYEMVFEPDLPPKQKSYAVGPLTVNATGDITIDAVSGMTIPDTTAIVRVQSSKRVGTLQMDAKDSQALADALSALPQQCGQCGHDRADHWADEDGYSGCGDDCACKEYEQC